jgi:hypothetical protein
MKGAHLFSPVPIYAGLGPVASRFVDQVLHEENDIQQDKDKLLSWRPGRHPTRLQEQLVEAWGYLLVAYEDVDPSEMDAIAHWHVEPVNRKLAEWGCDIRLDPAGTGKLVFYLAALVEFTRRWLEEGESGYWLPKAEKPAFALNTEQHGLQFSSYRGSPVVVIPVQEGGWVFVTEAREELSRFDLFEKCLEIWTRKEPISEYPGVVLPYWNIAHHEVDVSPLCGLEATDVANQIWWIAQALMECDCSFCLDGTYFKAAFAAALKRAFSMPKDPGDYLVMDHDLYYAMVSPKRFIIAVGYIPVSAFSQTKVTLD